MAVPSDVVQKVSREIGRPGRPHRIMIQGEMVDTGCFEWALPGDTGGAWGILARQRELVDLYMDTLAHDPTDPVLPQILAEAEELFAPYKPHKLADGTKFYDIHDLTKGDRRSLLHSALWRVRALLADDPVSAYLGPHEEGLNSDLLLVAPTHDQFDILRWLRTDAINWGFDTEAAIGKLQEIDAALGIDIVAVGLDLVEFLVLRLPTGDEAARWARWLRKFCPGVREPGKSLRAGRVLLWWD